MLFIYMEEELEFCFVVLLQAHADGVVDDEDLLLLTIALEEDNCKERLSYGPRLDIDSLKAEKCVQMFRFSQDEIRELVILLRLPGTFQFYNRQTWTGLEGLCVVLRRLAYPNRLGDLDTVFGRSPTSLSIIFNVSCNFIVTTWRRHLEDFIQAPFFDRALLLRYTHAVGRVCPLQTCFGFIDGTVRPVCRPSRNQQAFYNGHKRIHSLKYQTVVGPDGIILHLSGPLEGRRHDSAMLAESGLLASLSHLPLAPNGQNFCIYGDAAYPLRPQLIVSFLGNHLTAQQQQFNQQMSAARIAVEWGFAKVLKYFAFVDFRKNQKLLLQPVASHYFCAVLLANCHTCFNGNEATSHFTLNPPSIYEYLS